MKIRFGLCHLDHSDMSNFSEGKEKVCFRLKRIRSSRATGIISLYKTLKKFGERLTVTGSVMKVRC